LAARQDDPYGQRLLPAGLPRLFCFYHPSQQNTQTDRLTPEMFQQVLRDIGDFLGS
jgi:uracil-DNA glycosylase